MVYYRSRLHSQLNSTDVSLCVNLLRLLICFLAFCHSLMPWREFFWKDLPVSNLNGMGRIKV